MDKETSERIEWGCCLVALAGSVYALYLLAKHWGWLWFLS